MSAYLTGRQREMLRLLGEGHSAESASAVMGICVGTGKNLLRMARDRLGINTYGLVGLVARQEGQRQAEEEYRARKTRL